MILLITMIACGFALIFAQCLDVEPTWLLVWTFWAAAAIFAIIIFILDNTEIIGDDDDDFSI